MRRSPFLIVLIVVLSILGNATGVIAAPGQQSRTNPSGADVKAPKQTRLDLRNVTFLSTGAVSAQGYLRGKHVANVVATPGSVVKVVSPPSTDRRGRLRVGIFPPEATTQAETLQRAARYGASGRTPATDRAALEELSGNNLPVRSAAGLPCAASTASECEENHGPLPTDGLAGGEPEDVCVEPGPRTPMVPDRCVLDTTRPPDPGVGISQQTDPRHMILDASPQEIAIATLPTPAEMILVPGALAPAAAAEVNTTSNSTNRGGVIHDSGCAEVVDRVKWRGCFLRKTVNESERGWHYSGDQSEAGGHGDAWYAVTGGTTDHRYKNARSLVLRHRPRVSRTPDSGTCTEVTINVAFEGTGLSVTFPLCKEKIDPHDSNTRFYTHWGGHAHSRVVGTAAMNFVKAPDGTRAGFNYWVAENWCWC